MQVLVIKQRWNEDKCRCESKELINKGIRDGVLAIVNVNLKCSENIYEKELHPNKMIYNSTLNDYEKICILVNAVPAQYT